MSDWFMSSRFSIVQPPESRMSMAPIPSASARITGRRASAAPKSAMRMTESGRTSLRLRGRAPANSRPRSSRISSPPSNTTVFSASKSACVDMLYVRRSATASSSSRRLRVSAFVSARKSTIMACNSSVFPGISSDRSFSSPTSRDKSNNSS